jgi:hypothetical protein
MDVGVISESAMRNPEELIWMDAIQDFWWTNYIQGIKFGPGHNTDDAFILTKYKAMTDTGSSCSYFPDLYYNWIMKNLLKDVTAGSIQYDKDSWGYIIPSSEKSNL